MALKRCPVSSTGSSPQSASYASCKLAERFPTLWEFLTSSKWEDGGERCTGTMTLMAEQGMVKAALNDRDAGASCFVSGRTLSSLLEAVEKGLDGASLEWRVKRDERPKGGKGGR